VRIGSGVAIVAVVAGGGVAAYAAHTDGPDHYRTAAVTTADVDQTLALSGTVDSSGRSDLSFGTSGTVAKLAVGVGDTVAKGEVLARLDTISLNKAVIKANAQLAAARAQLAKDEDTQASAVSAASTSSSSGTSGSSTSGGSTSKAPSTSGSSSTSSGNDSTTGGSHGSGSTSGSNAGSAALAKALAQLQQQQKAVEIAQTAVSTAITAAQDATKQEATACAASQTAPSPSASDSASADGSASADAGSGSGNTSGAGSSTSTDACTSAITDVQDAQQKVADAEYSGSGNLKDALTTLSNTLSGAAKAANAAASGAVAGQTPSGSKSGSNGSGGTSQSTQSSQSGKGSSTQSSGTRGSSQGASAGSSQSTSSTSSSRSSSSGGTGSGQSVTAATLAKDQASIDSAKATLVQASQALRGATIKAPARGTIGQISVGQGDSASAGSTAIVVLAPGTTTAELSVSSTQVAQLKVGQKAQVTPAGATQAYSGSVTRIGQIPSSSTTGSSTYPVTVTLDKRGLNLLSGATAAVDITLGEADHVLTVPTSAVSNDSVEVYADGKVSRVRVTTGLVGRTRTVVTAGLRAGQDVVLADMSTALPTSGSETSTRLGGGAAGSFGGGFSGGSFGGGGFGGQG